MEKLIPIKQIQNEKEHLENKMIAKREKLNQDFNQQKYLGLNHQIRWIQKHYELMQRV